MDRHARHECQLRVICAAGRAVVTAISVFGFHSGAGARHGSGGADRGACDVVGRKDRQCHPGVVRARGGGAPHNPGRSSSAGRSEAVLLVSDGKALNHDTLYQLGVAVTDKAAVVDACHRAVRLGAHVEKP